MPAFVPQCQYDVFISYAQVAEKEWVWGFCEKLQEHLDRELHQDKAASIFWDRNELAGDSPLTAEITQALSNTATLLIVLSKAYLDRPWCRRERESFFNEVGTSSRRAFVVLLEDVPKEEHPPEIQALEVLGFKFWEQHPESDRPGVNRPLPLNGDPFDGKIRELAVAVAARLNEFKKDRPKEVQPVGVTRSRLTGAKVFLADGVSGPPAKDLEEARSAVRNWLTEQRAVVLPEEKGSLYEAFYDNQAQCEATFDKLVKEATVFVQLLGRKGDDEGYESWLCERAEAAGKVPGKDLLLWRSKSLTADSINSKKHRDLVFSEQLQVISCDLSAFRPLLAKHIQDIDREREVQRRLSKLSMEDRGTAKANRSMVIVLVDYAKQDELLIQNLRKQLTHYNVQYEPAMNARDFCEMLQSSEFSGVTFTFGDSCPEEWAIERLKATRPFRLGNRAVKRLCVGVYRDNSDRDLPGTSGMDVIIDGDPKSMAQFVEKLREVAK
jgi:hypothetical protein